MTRLLALPFLVLLATAACSDIAPRTGVLDADAPDLGKADGTDRADRECGVVLRTAGRPSVPGGFEVDCSAGSCWVVLEGTVDVADALTAETEAVGVLFRSTWQPGWFEAPAEPVTDVEPGFRRHAFRLAEGTIPSGASTTSLSRTVLELIPVVHMHSGERLFDHNRRADDFDVYPLSADGWFTVADDPSVCHAEPTTRSTLRFPADWRNEQRGAITSGGDVTIEYDISRLPDCRGTHNGHPAWDLRAHMRFEPSGVTVDGTVREFDSVLGTPVNTAHSIPFTGRVPARTTELQVWFEGFTGAGSSCRAWDSNYGENYRFAVASAVPATVGWAGGWGGSFTRECAHRDGMADPAVVDSYVMERACTFVDADVWVAGVTDGAEEHPELVVAEVEWSVDGMDPRREPLAYVGRVGNDHRYRWELPRAEMLRTPWDRIEYAFTFSTDGKGFYRVGREEGPDGGPPRIVERAPSFCPTGWPEERCVRP